MSEIRKHSEAQTAWIFSAVKQFLDKWYKKIPLEDGDWVQLLEESKFLEEKSRKDPLTIQLLVTVISYFEKVDKDAKEAKLKKVS